MGLRRCSRLAARIAVGCGVTFTAAALLIHNRLRKRAEREDRAVWCRPEHAKGTRRFALALQMEAIVERCKELQHPCYIPPFWAFDPWVNVLWFMIKQKILTATFWMQHAFLAGAEPLLQRDHVILEDGETVSIDYYNDSMTQGLPDNAPIVCVLHTITGDGPSSIWYLQEAAKRGWRSCVFNRRGACRKLGRPVFNLMGCARDTKEQLAEVKKRFPDARFMGMVGISAGSGAIINFLGKEKHLARVDAACSLCPAYDIETAFTSLKQKYPLADGQILSSLKQRFVVKNETLLRQHNPDAVDALLKADSVQEFFEEHIAFSGISEKEYWSICNPMNHVHGVSCPLLILNSNDDMVCMKDNINSTLPANEGGAILVQTSMGSHVAYCENSFGSGSYLCRLSLDFLQAAMEVETHAVDLSPPETAR